MKKLKKEKLRFLFDRLSEFHRVIGPKIGRSYDPCISCSFHLVVLEGNKQGKMPEGIGSDRA